MALREVGVPPGITDFVRGTLQYAIHGCVVEVALHFFFGGEDLIPEMFKRLLSLWEHGAVEVVPYFAYYLKRHIEPDRGSHGPWAREMTMTLAGHTKAVGSR